MDWITPFFTKRFLEDLPHFSLAILTIKNFASAAAFLIDAPLLSIVPLPCCVAFICGLSGIYVDDGYDVHVDFQFLCCHLH